jgi:GWxTD domain-containing protein
MKKATLALLFSLTASILRAQNPMSKDSRVGIPVFEVDFSSFADSTSGKTRLEVYYKLRNAGFTFVKKEGEYRAGYELEIFVTGPDGREAASRRAREEFSVKTYDQTQSEESFRVNAAHFALFPDDYKVKVQVTDQASGEVSATSRKVHLPDYRRGPLAASGLVLIGDFADSAELPLFKKEGRTVIPSVSRIFGPPDSALNFYFEIYRNRDGLDSCQAAFEVTQRYHGTWVRETLRVALEKSPVPVFADLPVGQLPPGDYRLKLALREGKKELAHQEADFRINWNWKAALTHNFPDVLEILSYFSRESDLKTLKKAPPEKRAETWEGFWKERDPTPATEENEARREFERRVRFTDAYFSHMGLPGWKSDMGKIYIRYGDPDQVDEDPTGLRNTNPYVDDFSRTNTSRIRQTGHPTQTWYYFSVRRAFSFEDVTGHGSWVLRPPFDGRRF